MDCTLFVAYQVVMQFGVPCQFIIDIDDCSARITEQNVNTFLLERFKKDLRTCQFH